VDRAGPGKSVFSIIRRPSVHETRIAEHEKVIAGFSYEPENISPIKSQVKNQVKFKPLVASTQLLAPVTSSEDDEDDEDDEED
jgi:hypothetical protein